MKIAEIFKSIHGECNGHHQGRVVTFIRISGCNLKCSYCDTPHTQDPEYGMEMLTSRILSEVQRLKSKYICLTGGEPLLHKDSIELLQILWKNGYKISVETNGTIDITPYHRYVESFVIDMKGPSSGHSNTFMMKNFIGLRSTDVVKLLIADKRDFDYAMDHIKFLEKNNSFAVIAMSPLEFSMSKEQLASMMIDTFGCNAVLSLQIHKMLDLK